MAIKIDPLRKENQASGTTSMTVIAEAPAAHELTTAEARNTVMQYARAAGFPARGLGGIPSPYPVDQEGKTDDDLILGKRPIKHWEAAYQVNSGLGV